MPSLEDVMGRIDREICWKRDKDVVDSHCCDDMFGSGARNMTWGRFCPSSRARA